MPVERLRALVAADPDARLRRAASGPLGRGHLEADRRARLGRPRGARVGGRRRRQDGRDRGARRGGRPPRAALTARRDAVRRRSRCALGYAGRRRVARADRRRRGRASLAITDARGSWSPETAASTRARTATGVVLSGAAHFVQDAFKADCPRRLGARRARRSCCARCPPTARGSRSRRTTSTTSRAIRPRVRFDGRARARRERDLRRRRRALRRAWPALLVAVAADLCGTSEWQLQTTVEYAKQRKAVRAARSASSRR